MVMGRSKKMVRDQQTSYLPIELIGEILSTLPAKSVLRFKIVSKSWRSLITSKSFIKTHLQHAPRNTKALLIKGIRYPEPTLWQTSLMSLFDSPDRDAAELISIPTDKSVESIVIVGCCNGLVCLELNNKHLMLWNPCTRVSKQLPTAPKRVCCACYGFGYDESSDDYKVLFFEMLYKHENIYLYNLKTDSWKSMVSDPHRVWCDFLFGVRGELVSGKLHWTGDRNIGFFDLKREAFGMLEQPPYAAASWPYLGKFRDCLSLLYIHQDLVHVWVMNKYGVKECWEKVMEVDYLYIPSPVWGSPSWIDRGEDVMLLMKQLLFYHRKRDGSGYEFVRMVSNSLCDEIYIHSESLVSPCD